MKKTSLVVHFAVAAAALLLPSISTAASLSFDRRLDAGGIAIVSSTCPVATSSGHVMFDLVQNGGTIRMATLGNIVATDGSFGAFIKFPDNSPTGAAVVSAICPDGTVVSSAVTLQPFAGSLPLPSPILTDPTIPVGELTRVWAAQPKAIPYRPL